MWFLIIFGVFAVQQASGVIYKLPPSEYYQMPQLVDIDEYEPCMRETGDVYCFVSAQLYGNKSDPLYKKIVEFSEATVTHFDHTHLHRGICPKQSCQQHMNTSSDLTEVIEACLNETLTRDYRLTSKMFYTVCHDHGASRFDTADYVFGGIVLVLLGLSLLGSLYDFYCQHGKDTTGGKYLLSFSVRQNWRRLAAPPSTDPYQKRLRVLFGIKTISSFMVISAHVGIPAAFMSKNALFLEQLYDRWLFLVLINSTHIVQTFFFTSALLMSYNKLKGERKKPITWQNLPKNVLDRWLRLTPPYAFLLFYVMTWARHSSQGPFSGVALISESNSCWENWWRHLLYIDNYKDNSRCMIHGWYVAADFQLSVLGLALFALLSSNRLRKIVISAAVVIGLMTPAAHVYFQNLPAVLLVTPELVLNFFVTDPTFNNLYKRGHTNIICYALGLGFSYFLFNLKESEIGADKFKKYRALYWLIWPTMVLIMSVGILFYVDGIVIPMGVRMVYSGFIKLLFGLLLGLFIFFTAVKVDRPVRNFLNWSGWARLYRLTYFSYLVHVPLIRWFAADSLMMIHGTPIWHLHNYVAILTLSFILAVPLYIFIEAPLSECTRLTMNPAPAKKATLPTLVTDSKETAEVKL